jgi:malate synthase
MNVPHIERTLDRLLGSGSCYLPLQYYESMFNMLNTRNAAFMATAEAVTLPNRHLVNPVNSAPAPFDARRDLPAGFMEFFLPLHREFTPRQRMHAARRGEALQRSLEGDKPAHQFPSDTVRNGWRISLPPWCQDQRNQMTGPADDAELCVKMLNSGAPGVMLDVEDSCVNEWGHQELGVANILACLRGQLTYFDQKRNRTITIQPSSTIIFTRPRGLHLNQAGLIPGELVSASLFDVARIVYQIDPAELKHPLCFYIPKSESAREALWWRDLFQAVAKWRGLPHDYIKCMALVESHPLAFQMEEFIYNLRDHIVGLNLGRWDYMASLIHFNFDDPDWVLPDRNTIPYNVPFFQNLRELMPEICHHRGILAIGGMTALYPSREDPKLNARALAVLEKDKKNEADCLMDGAWTGHPDQNAIAVAQFPYPNQLSSRPGKTCRYSNLRPKPEGVGTRSANGTRAAVRTVIRYRHGVLSGRGASLLDGYMEDLATDRIYRLMIAQRVMHRDLVAIVDENGNSVKHTPEFVTQLFDEELDRLLAEVQASGNANEVAPMRRAREISEAMIVNGEFNPV